MTTEQLERRAPAEGGNVSEARQMTDIAMQTLKICGVGNMEAMTEAIYEAIEAQMGLMLSYPQLERLATRAYLLNAGDAQ